MTRWRALVGLAALLGAAGAGARELWTRDEARLELSGSLREIAAATRATDVDDFTRASLEPVAPGVPLPICQLAETFLACPAFDEVGEDPTLTSLSRLRLELDARWGAGLSGRVVYDHEWWAATRESFEADFGGAFGVPPFLDLDWTIRSTARSEWSHSFYRAFVRWEQGPWELVVGRQRIPWGVGRLWNPMDRFDRSEPLAIEADQHEAADAVKARWSFTGFTFAEGIYAAGKRGKDRDFAARFGTVVRNVDASLMAGSFDGAPTTGFDLASNLGGAAGRVEAVWTAPQRPVRRFGELRADELPPYWQVVVSIDDDLNVGSGVYVLLEYLYNGNALGFGRGKPGPFLGFYEESAALVQGVPARVVEPGDADLFGSSAVVTRSRHLTGGQLGYDLTPELRGELLVLLDWDGWSASYFPSLRYSPLGWLELSLGAQLFSGTRRSEFGANEPVGFLLVEAFF